MTNDELITALRADASQCLFENQSEVYAGALSKRLTQAADALTVERVARQEAEQGRKEAIEAARTAIKARLLEAQLVKAADQAREVSEAMRNTLVVDFDAAKVLLRQQLTAADQARAEAQDKAARLRAQAVEMSVTLSEAGCGAMPLAQGVRWLVEARAEAEQQRTLYMELLLAVGNKYPDESRHQTALRYIKQAEQGSAIPAAPASATSVPAKAEGWE